MIINVLVSIFSLVCTPLQNDEDKKYRLYVFLLEDCPICIQYSDELNQLYKKYHDDVEFIGLFPNFSSKPTKIDSYKTKYGVEFLLKTDYYKKKSKELGATKTPEAFLVDTRTDEIIYQGAISNAYYKPGRLRKTGIINYLDLAIESILNNTEIATKKTEAIGCFINFNDNLSKATSN